MKKTNIIFTILIISFISPFTAVRSQDPPEDFLTDVSISTTQLHEWMPSITSLIHRQNLKQGTRQAQSRFSSQLDGETKIKKR